MQALHVLAAYRSSFSGTPSPIVAVENGSPEHPSPHDTDTSSDANKTRRASRAEKKWQQVFEMAVNNHRCKYVCTAI